jgi:hypothetical protein
MNDRPLDLALTRLEQSVAALVVGQAAHWRDMRRAVDDLTQRAQTFTSAPSDPLSILFKIFH